MISEENQINLSRIDKEIEFLTLVKNKYYPEASEVDFIDWQGKLSDEEMDEKFEMIKKDKKISFKAIVIGVGNYQAEGYHPLPQCNKDLEDWQ